MWGIVSLAASPYGAPSTSLQTWRKRKKPGSTYVPSLVGICVSATKQIQMNLKKPRNPKMRQEPCIANVKKGFFTLALRGICSFASFEGDLKGDT